MMAFLSQAELSHLQPIASQLHGWMWSCHYRRAPTTSTSRFTGETSGQPTATRKAPCCQSTTRQTLRGISRSSKVRFDRLVEASCRHIDQVQRSSRQRAAHLHQLGRLPRIDAVTATSREFKYLFSNRELQELVNQRNKISLFDSSGNPVLSKVIDAYVMNVLGTDYIVNARIVFGGTPSLAKDFIGLIHSIQMFKDQASPFSLPSEATDPGSILFSIQAPTTSNGILLHDMVHNHKYRSNTYSTTFERRATHHAFKHSTTSTIDSHFTDLSSASGKLILKRFQALTAVDSFIDKQFFDSWTINNNYAFKVKITNLKYEDSPLSYTQSQLTFPLYSFEYSIPGTSTHFVFGLYHLVENQASLPNEGWLQVNFYEVLSDGSLNLISANTDISLNFGSLSSPRPSNKPGLLHHRSCLRVEEKYDVSRSERSSADISHEQSRLVLDSQQICADADWLRLQDPMDFTARRREH